MYKYWLLEGWLHVVVKCVISTGDCLINHNYWVSMMSLSPISYVALLKLNEEGENPSNCLLGKRFTVVCIHLSPFTRTIAKLLSCKQTTISSRTEKHTYSEEDHLNNVANYADISLSGPFPPPTSSSHPSFFPSLHVEAYTLVTCPSTQLLCVIAIRRDGRGGSQIRA